MTLARATVWVVTCDAPKCRSVAVPDTAHTTRPEARSGRYMLLAGQVDALVRARADGWAAVLEPDHLNYCPEHAHMTTPNA